MEGTSRDQPQKSSTKKNTTRWKPFWIHNAKEEGLKTWEPFSLLKGLADEALWEFYKSYPDKLHPGSFQL